MNSSKTHAIDLADWEVQALMKGSLTALLRPIDPPPMLVRAKGSRRHVWGGQMPDGSFHDVENDALHRFSDTCPFGTTGAAIFVREAWTSIGYGRSWGAELHYRADGNDLSIWKQREIGQYILSPCPDRDDTWRPLRFEPWREASMMPAWASRITASIRYVEAVDMLNLTPFTLAHCGPLLERPVKRWCWRIDLGAVVVLESSAVFKHKFDPMIGVTI